MTRDGSSRFVCPRRDGPGQRGAPGNRTAWPVMGRSSRNSEGRNVRKVLPCIRSWLPAVMTGEPVLPGAITCLLDFVLLGGSGRSSCLLSVVGRYFLLHSSGFTCG